MTMIFISKVIATLLCVVSGFTQKNPGYQRDNHKKGINYSYKEFAEKARSWSRALAIFPEAKETCEQYETNDLKNSKKCYKIEVSAPERDHNYKNKLGEDAKKGHKNEMNLFSIMLYSLNNYNRTLDYWTQGIDKVKLVTRTKLKCEPMLLPMDHIGMTIATPGTFSISHTDETYVLNAWKFKEKLDIWFSSIEGFGALGPTFIGNYKKSHRRAVRKSLQKAYEAFPDSSCTPTLVEAVLMCPPVKVQRMLYMNGEEVSPKFFDLPGMYIQNTEGRFFESFSASIDYTRD